ncbi:hypothetical protein AAG906_003054 [Vitis piasezkii]
MEHFLLRLQERRAYSDVEDQVVWTKSKDGRFSVKSLYKALELYGAFKEGAIWLTNVICFFQRKSLLITSSCIRFFPSELGDDVDRIDAVDPAKKTAFEIKAKLRRTIEAEGIPYTCVCNNLFAGYFLPTLSQFGATASPRDKVIILGDGNPKELHMTHCQFTTAKQKQMNVILAINHSVFVKGDHTDFEIEPSFRVEASEEYPDVKCTLWMSTSIHLPETSRRRDVRNSSPKK